MCADYQTESGTVCEVANLINPNKTSGVAVHKKRCDEGTEEEEGDTYLVQHHVVTHLREPRTLVLAWGTTRVWACRQYLARGSRCWIVRLWKQQSMTSFS